MALPIRKKDENIFDQIGGFFGDVGKNVGNFFAAFTQPQQNQRPTQQPQFRPQQPSGPVQPGQFNTGVQGLMVGNRGVAQQKPLYRPAPFKPQSLDEYKQEKQSAIQSVVDTGKPPQGTTLSEQEVKDALMKRVQNQAGGTPTTRAINTAVIKPAQGVAKAVGGAAEQVLKDPVGTAVNIAQSPFRAGASVGLSTGLLKPNTDQGTYKARGLGQAFFGGEDIEKFDPEKTGRRIAEETGNIIKDQENSGFGSNIDPRVAAFLGIGGLVSELAPGRGAKKVTVKPSEAKRLADTVTEAAAQAGEKIGPTVPGIREERMKELKRTNQIYDADRKLLPVPSEDSIAPTFSRNQGGDLSQEIATAANAQKQRYAAPTFRERFGEAINPYRAGARIDQAFAKQQGIAQRDIPKTQSLEALAERTRNSGQEAEGFLKSSSIAPIVQKYGANGKSAEEFNTYRTFMRDLEQRSDGRAPLYRDYSDTQMAKYVSDYEARNPEARQDLKSLVMDIERVQDEAVARGVVDAETVNAARMKKDGGRYEFYTPVTRAQAENLERATINANGVGSIGKQSIVQDLKGSDIPLDPSFDSLTGYVNNAYRQMAKAQTSQAFADRVRQGVVPGARFVDTAENDAARRGMRNEQKRTGQPKNMNDYAELVPDPTTGLQVISGRSNGSTFKIEVTPEQARFLQGLGEEKLNSLLRIAKAAQTPIRTVLTGALNLPFQIISAGFNAIMGPALSPQGFRVLGPRAISESMRAFNRNAEFQKILRANGAQRFTGNLEAGTGQGKGLFRTPSTAEGLAAQKNLLTRFAFNAKSPARAWQQLDMFGAAIENSQRTGIAKAAFDARVRKGGNEAEAIADAVYAYNNVLPNFGRMSSTVRQVDSLLMYGGASVAGTRSLLTAIKRDPVGVSTRLGLITTGLVGLTAYTMSQDEAQAFYEDMERSGKSYLTDNNGIVVLPGAHKVTREEAESGEGREGEWLGVVKIPLPPELRPINQAIKSQMLANANETGVPLGRYAQAAFDFVTGGARTLSNPNVDLIYGLATNVDRNTGREIVPEELARLSPDKQVHSGTSEVAKNLGSFLGVSPLKVDYVLSKGGFPGQIAKGAGEEGGPLKAAGDAAANRFTNTFGEKDSTKFFKTLGQIADSIPAEDDRKAFQALHAKKDDDSRSLDKTAERYQTLLARPDVLEAERQLDAYSRAQGKPGNPLFDLSPEQQEKVFRYRASKDLNAAKQAYDKNGDPLYTALGLDEKWYDDFRNAESGFYSSIKEAKQDDETNTALSFSGAQRPQAGPELQERLDVYYSLPSGTGERSAFLKSNPDVLEHWASGDQFTNAERIAMGLKVLDDEEGGNSGGSGFARRGGGGGGSRGGSNPNKIFIRSSDYDNPIAIDAAPKPKITARNNTKKVTIKPRKARNAKVTTTKQKSGKIKVNNQKKQTA